VDECKTNGQRGLEGEFWWEVALGGPLWTARTFHHQNRSGHGSADEGTEQSRPRKQLLHLRERRQTLQRGASFDERGCCE